MRLIDIDKISKDTEMYYGGFTSYSSAMIDEAEIVKAIPIEWIVKRINHYSDLILTYPNEKELLYSQTELISLLEEWEKENKD